MEQMDQYEPVDERELQSPDAQGPVVSQDRADEIVAGLRSKSGRKKEPKLTVAKEKSNSKPATKTAVKPAPKSPPPSDNGAEEDGDDVEDSCDADCCDADCCDAPATLPAATAPIVRYPLPPPPNPRNCGRAAAAFLASCAAFVSFAS